MKQVSVQDAKAHLSRLLDAVCEGEQVVISRGGRPVARLVPMEARTPWHGRSDGLIDLAADFDVEDTVLPPKR
jgi:prevent-host-death family protein